MKFSVIDEIGFSVVSLIVVIPFGVFVDGRKLSKYFLGVIKLRTHCGISNFADHSAEPFVRFEIARKLDTHVAFQQRTNGSNDKPWFALIVVEIFVQDGVVLEIVAADDIVDVALADGRVVFAQSD